MMCSEAYVINDLSTSYGRRNNSVWISGIVTWHVLGGRGSGGGASVLLSGGRWFDTPESACQSVHGQDAEPQTAPDVLGHLAWWLPPSVYELYVWITVSRFGKKRQLNVKDIFFLLIYNQGCVCNTFWKQAQENSAALNDFSNAHCLAQACVAAALKVQKVK